MKNCRICFAVFCFKLLPKFSNLINSNGCVEKITSKSIRLYPVFIQKKIWIKKKEFISGEQIWNSGNYIYDYARSFFRNDFNPSCFTGILYL